jgi:hypothetical protein
MVRRPTSKIRIEGQPWATPCTASRGSAIYGIKIGIIELMHLALLLSIKIQCFGPQTKTSHA